MAAGFAMRPISTNWATLWNALDVEHIDALEERRSDEAFLLVWRSRLSRRFRVLSAAEHHALRRLERGGVLGDLASDTDSDRLADWLARWLDERVFEGFEVNW
jgi:hypothetical protein